MQSPEEPGFRKRVVTLADGRALVYYDLVPAPESKPAAPAPREPQQRKG